MINILKWRALSKERKGAVVGAIFFVFGAAIDYFLIEGGSASFTTWIFLFLSVLFLALSIQASDNVIKRAAAILGYSPF